MIDNVPRCQIGDFRTMNGNRDVGSQLLESFCSAKGNHLRSSHPGDGNFKNHYPTKNYDSMLPVLELMLFRRVRPQCITKMVVLRENRKRRNPNGG